MATALEEAFREIGTLVREGWAGRRFELDIAAEGGREVYHVRRPADAGLTIEVLDVRPHLRHLLLDVTGERLPIAGQFLCGHDESHYFAAELPAGSDVRTVRRAMEALKPALVVKEQRRKGVVRRRAERRTAAYIRQGEWFFLPRPKLVVPPATVLFDQVLRRGRGKPHRVEQMAQFPGRAETFVRGHVRHADHETLLLDVWHRVVVNTEVVASPEELAREQQRLQGVAWLD